MKNIIKIALSTLIIFTMSTTTLSADISKGQKLYLKKLRNYCKMDSAKMALKHSQAQWKIINDDGKLAAEIKSICPGVPDKSLDAKYLIHSFDFFHEYANDSGKIPSC